MRTAFVAIAALGVFAISAHAQTVKLWKWVNKDGKVTYSEEPPPRDAVTVQEKHLESPEGAVQSGTPSESITLPATAEPPSATSPAPAGSASGRAARRGAAAAEAESPER